MCKLQDNFDSQTTVPPDLIIISEIWLNDLRSEEFGCLENYSFFRRDRGGKLSAYLQVVVFFVQQEMHYSKCYEPFDILNFIINFKLYVSLVYFAPTSAVPYN